MPKYKGSGRVEEGFNFEDVEADSEDEARQIIEDRMRSGAAGIQGGDCGGGSIIDDCTNTVTIDTIEDDNCWRCNNPEDECTCED